MQSPDLMSDWALWQINAASGRTMFLRNGHLEANQTQHHMYHTEWITIDTASTSQWADGLPLIGWGADEMQDDEAAGHCGHCGAQSFCIVHLEELCTIRDRFILCCSAVHSARSSRILHALQVVTNGSRIWVLDQHHDRYSGAGPWGLAKSVNAERGQMLHCVYVKNLATHWAALAFAYPSESQLIIQNNASCEGARLSIAPRAAPVGCALELALHDRGSLSSLTVQAQLVQPDATTCSSKRA